MKNSIYKLLLYCLAGLIFSSASLAQTQIKQLEDRVAKASNGDADSALWLGRYYSDKRNPDHNTNDAERWLTKAAELGSKVAIIEIGYDKPYMAITNFKCGAVNATVSTSCAEISQKEARPICYAQHVSLRDARNKSETFLFNSFYKDDLTIAMNAECVHSESTNWIVIYSSNFGNGETCTDCEREDYFHDTKYVGSTKSRRGRNIVVGYQVATESVLDAVTKARHESVTRMQRFDLNTYPEIKRKE